MLETAHDDDVTPVGRVSPERGDSVGRKTRLPGATPNEPLAKLKIFEEANGKLLEAMAGLCASMTEVEGTVGNHGVKMEVNVRPWSTIVFAQRYLLTALAMDWRIYLVFSSSSAEVDLEVENGEPCSFYRPQLCS